MPEVVSPLSPSAIGTEIAAGGGVQVVSFTWPTANLSVLVPFVVNETMVITNSFVLVGSLSAGNYDIGVYDSAFALLGHIGATAVPAVSTLGNVALSLTLTPGHYWLALAGSLATTNAFAGISMASIVRARMLGCREATGNMPLATTPTPVAWASIQIPLFGISEFAV